MTFKWETSIRLFFLLSIITFTRTTIIVVAAVAVVGETEVIIEPSSSTTTRTIDSAEKSITQEISCRSTSIPIYTTAVITKDDTDGSNFSPNISTSTSTSTFTSTTIKTITSCQKVYRIATLNNNPRRCLHVPKEIEYTKGIACKDFHSSVRLLLLLLNYLFISCLHIYIYLLSTLYD